MCYLNLLHILVFCSCFSFLLGPLYGQDDAQYSALISSFSYPETKLKPYEWRYLRVEVPPWFSTVSITVLSSVDVDQRSTGKLSKVVFPTICIREGSLPLPDISNTYLRDIEVNHFLNGTVRSAEQCVASKKNLTVILTSEQISPGAWYVGFFNGLGPERTQSKMINRGSSYRFSAEVSIRGCRDPTIWGLYCNQTTELLYCTQSEILTHGRNLLGHPMNKYKGNLRYKLYYALQGEEKVLETTSGQSTIDDSAIVCKSSSNGACLANGESKLYYFDILDSTSSLNFTPTDIRSNMTSRSNDTVNILIMCYARYNAMPLVSLYDYTNDISRAPLVIEFPKTGRWFVLVHVTERTTKREINESDITRGFLCFSLEWQLYGCPYGKVGSTCLWNQHVLQRVLKRSSSLPYESFYWPVEQNVLMKSSSFPVGRILSNSSSEENVNIAWTYFLLEVPRGAGGANIHFQLISDASQNFGVYARFGGVSSLEAFDFFVNGTQNSNVSMFLDVSDTIQGKINFYILYAREGIWNIGLKHPIGNSVKDPVLMSITLEGCPERCFSKGTCHSAADESGLTLYSFCSCDRHHGGFDCSIELVTRQDNTAILPKFHVGRIWQSVSLIASNAAAILPAVWALRQKAFAEWVLFSSSGISSGLYHACDAGSWCVLSFRVLQFMDFWLSFMAVVSTFLYMATIDEVSKRAIYTTVSILTALMAATGPTRSANIILVVAIGTLGLLIAWVIEFSSTIKAIIRSLRCHFDIHQRWQRTKGWFYNLVKALRKRFRWPFILLGLTALSAAGISWKLETSKSYWIWHSIWHVTIYTSSFFFLCSISAKNHSQECAQGNYELTRQNSSSRGELGDNPEPRSPNRIP